MSYGTVNQRLGAVNCHPVHFAPSQAEADEEEEADHCVQIVL